MSNSFTQVFGGTTIYPADVSYLPLALTGNISLEWPLEATAGSTVVARIIDITPSGAYTITMPEATAVSVGQTVLFNNLGPSTVAVNKANGSAILSIGAGEQWQAYLIDNTTVGGTWRTLRYGAATAQAQAAALAGPGLVTDGSQLAQNYEVIDFSVTPYTLTGPDRAKVFVWDGGLGTLNLPSAPAAGDGWFVQVRNAGQGDLTIDPSGTELINAGSTLRLQPGDSAVIVSNGTQWFTIGLGQQAVFAFDYTSIAVTGGTYTLSGSELNRIAYKFTGTLVSNVTVVVPATVQQYWVNNSTTGAFTLSLRASGSGTSTPVTQASTSILYCDGTDIIPATTAVTFAGILPVSQGGTGANNAASARTNLGATGIGSSLFTATTAASARSTISAASSGANSDITSLSGLTTPLSVGQGGTGAATLTANGVVVGNGTSAVQVTAAGTTGQVLVGNTGGAPSWATLTGIGVTSFSGGTTGLTPASPTTGAITLAGTLGVANGGTGVTTSTGTGSVVLSNSPTLVTPALGAATATSLTLTKLALTVDSPFYTGGNISSGANNLAIGTTGATVFGIFTDNTERMRITSAGNVGLGTNNPANWRMYMSQTGSDLLTLYNSSGTGVQLVMADQGWQGGVNMTNGNLILQAGGITERMRIDGSGNVGIGTTTPSSYGKFTVVGSGDIANFDTPSGATGIALFENGQGRGRIRTLNGSNGLAFLYGSTEGMRIDASGNVGIGTSAPGYTVDVRTGASNGLRVGSNSNSFGTLLSWDNPLGLGGLFTVGAYDLAIGTNTTERMRITSAGDVGIGTASPLNKLHVVGGNANTLRIDNAGQQYTSADWYNANSSKASIYYDNTGAEFVTRTTVAAGLGFDTNLTRKMTITAGGNVGIGTATPSSKLNVLNGDIEISATGLGNTLFSFDGTTASLTVNSSSAPLTFGTNSAERMRITSTGVVGINTSSPSSGLDVNSVAIWCGTKTASSGAAGNIRFRDDTGTFRYAAGILGSPAATAFSIYDNIAANDRLTITSTGNVGIGTVSPNSLLQSSYGVPASVPAAGTGGHGLAVGSSGYGLTAGALTSGNAYLQATRWDGTATNYDLLLQPNGGNVGIGTSAPAQKLHTFIAAGNVSNLIESGSNTSVAVSTIYKTANRSWEIGQSPGIGDNSFTIYDLTSAAVRLTINTSGNVGIGTSSPSYPLEVRQDGASGATYIGSVNTTATGGSGAAGYLARAGSNFAYFYVRGDGTAYIDNATASPLGFAINGSERMRLDSSGNLLVGTTTVNGRLSVQAGTSATGNSAFFNVLDGTYNTYLQIQHSTTGVKLFNGNSFGAAANNLIFGNAATSETMRITSAGDVGIGTAPDSKLWVLSATGASLRVGYDGTSVNYYDAVTQIFRSANGGTERMRIDSSGNFLVGTTSATAGYLASINGALTLGNGSSLSWGGAYNSGSPTIGGSTNFLAFYPNGATSGETMRIDSSGNIGIGTTSPSQRLDIVSSSGSPSYARMSDGTVTFLVGAQPVLSSALLGTTSNHPVQFWANNSERARIDTSGNFLVGTTTSDGYRFKTEGSYPFLSKGTGGAALTAMSIWNNDTTGDNIFIVFSTEAGGTTRGSIDYNRAGGLTRYNTTSDYRAKDIVGPVQNSGAVVDALKVYDGKMKGATIERPMLIAHEAQEVVPYAVTGEKDAVNEDGTPKFQQIDVSSLVPLLIAEIQSLRARVAQLEGK